MSDQAYPSEIEEFENQFGQLDLDQQDASSLLPSFPPTYDYSYLNEGYTQDPDPYSYTSSQDAASTAGSSYSKSSSSRHSSSSKSSRSSRSSKGSTSSHNTSISRHSRRSTLNHGHLARQPRPANHGRIKLPCEWSKVDNCTEEFEADEVGVREWKQHIGRHIGPDYPPKSHCWFCDNYVWDAKDELFGGDKQQAFEARLDHIREHLLDGNVGVNNIKPDFSLFDHLRQKNLADQRMGSYQMTEDMLDDFILLGTQEPCDPSLIDIECNSAHNQQRAAKRKERKERKEKESKKGHK